MVIFFLFDIIMELPKNIDINEHAIELKRVNNYHMGQFTF